VFLYHTPFLCPWQGNPDQHSLVPTLLLYLSSHGPTGWYLLRTALLRDFSAPLPPRIESFSHFFFPSEQARANSQHCMSAATLYRVSRWILWLFSAENALSSVFYPSPQEPGLTKSLPTTPVQVLPSRRNISSSDIIQQKPPACFLTSRLVAKC
jgi:hypothetical protein